MSVPDSQMDRTNTEAAEIAESTEESLILTLLDLANHLTRNGGRIAQQEGLTAQQWLLLLQIAGDPNFPRPGVSAEAGTAVLASAIATARGVSRPTISALVGSLVERGLVSQAEEPGDRRQKALRATPKGLAALARIEPARRRANQALLAGFEAAEIALVLRVLRSCLDVLWAAGLSEAERQRFAEGPGEEGAAGRGPTGADRRAKG
jgi:DNA-binding MarR family transcriptional regulator